MSEAAVVESGAVVEPGAVVKPAAAPAAPLGREEPQVEAEAAAAVPSWLDGLPDELKGDKTLARYKSVEDLAKGAIEKQAMLGNRIELPKEGDADSFERFAAAVRPEKAEDYKIAVPEGMDGAYAEALRPVFHELGLHPSQVEGLVAMNNQYAAQQAEAAAAAGKEELAAIEAGMGKQEFAAAKLATNAWLTRMGIPVKFDTDLSRLVGAGNSVRLLFDIAARTGELGKIGDADLSLALGSMTPEQARQESAKLDAVALRNPNSPESKKMDEYAAIINKGTQQR